MRELAERHWQASVIALLLLSLAADICSKTQRVYVGFVFGAINAAGWAVLLSTKAPFTRAITLSAVAGYIAITGVGVVGFGEAITNRQAAGLLVGAIAVWLLA